MWGSFTSELVKLQRRNMILWSFGAGMFFPLLATILTIERATRYPVFGPGHGIRVTYAVLEQPDGLVHGVTDVSGLLGIVSLCVFAAAFSLEYSQGTLRNLLVREPRRTEFLIGKFVALALFMLIVVIVAIGISVAIAFILAPGKGISTSAWTSSAGLNDLFQSVFHAWLAAVFYGVFGAAFRLIPGFSEAWIRTPFYQNEAISQSVSAAFFVGLCLYLWRRSLSQGKESDQ